jgi:hypothetical protein
MSRASPSPRTGQTTAAACESTSAAAAVAAARAPRGVYGSVRAPPRQPVRPAPPARQSGRVAPWRTPSSRPDRPGRERPGHGEFSRLPDRQTAALLQSASRDGGYERITTLEHRDLVRPKLRRAQPGRAHARRRATQTMADREHHRARDRENAAIDSDERRPTDAPRVHRPSSPIRDLPRRIIPPQTLPNRHPWSRFRHPRGA